MTRYQFYHPPLSHLLSAAWVRFDLFLGTPYEEAFEHLQCLSLLYSVITLVPFGKILAELGFRGRALLAAYLLAAFHPTFYLFAGSINNDGLCLMFMTGAVLYTLRWYRKQSMGNILLISLFLLGGIWTKQNTFLITPAIGFVFLYVLDGKKLEGYGFEERPFDPVSGFRRSYGSSGACLERVQLYKIRDAF